MVWFKVDDSLAFHRKVIAAGNSAMGLWVRAGSWAAQQLTDGHVPHHVVTVLGTVKQAERLVRAGLWTESDEGYWFHDWTENDRNPTRSEVLLRRKRDSERQHRKRQKNQADPENSQGNEGRPPVTHEGSHGGSHGGCPDPPSRPDPTRVSPNGDTGVEDAARPDVDKLCTRMLERLHGNGVKASITKAWRDEARKLIDRDGRDVEQALQLVDWTADHEFWSANVHGLPKFRKQYDRLRMQWERDREGRQLRAVSGGYQPFRNPTDMSAYEGEL